MVEQFQLVESMVAGMMLVIVVVAMMDPHLIH
jgi:hypothetical protein